MTKAEFIKQLTADKSIFKENAEHVFDAVCAQIQGILVAGGEVSLPGVGKLKVKETAARTGRNPRTGEPLEIPAGRTVTFKMSSKLKDLM